jgi:arabinose-5-phosphate isomerase
MVSDLQSFLAKNADYILQATIEKEACPNNLAPTTSTTVQLVLGDALAVCLLEQKEFSSEDFAKIHPGGSLGKKLYMRVADIYIQNEVPKILAQEKLSDIIYEISSKRLGATAVVDKENNLLGIITDGDIRRMLQEGKDTDTVEAGDIMTKSPKFVYDTEMAAKAFHLMESNKITQMIVLDKENKYLGIIHLHDILKEGIV